MGTALGYAARHGGLAGVILLAPGHVPDSPDFQYKVQDSLAEAHRRLAAGTGGQRAVVDDVNQGSRLKVHATAAVYVSWFDADGPASMSRNAQVLDPRTPVLWVAGDRDDVALNVSKRFAFDLLPANSETHFAVIEGGHRRTPERAINVVAEWIKELIDGAGVRKTEEL